MDKDLKRLQNLAGIKKEPLTESKEILKESFEPKARFNAYFGKSVFHSDNFSIEFPTDLSDVRMDLYSYMRQSKDDSVYDLIDLEKNPKVMECNKKVQHLLETYKELVTGVCNQTILEIKQNIEQKLEEIKKKHNENS